MDLRPPEMENGVPVYQYVMPDIEQEIKEILDQLEGRYEPMASQLYETVYDGRERARYVEALEGYSRQLREAIMKKTAEREQITMVIDDLSAVLNNIETALNNDRALAEYTQQAASKVDATTMSPLKRAQVSNGAVGSGAVLQNAVRTNK